MSIVIRHIQTTATLIRGLLVVALALGLAVIVTPAREAAAAGAVQDPERTSQKVTGWGWHRNVTPAQVKSFLAQGYRIVDLEVRNASPRLDVAYVKNAGAYARTWYWYYGKTAAGVAAKLNEKKARLIDIEPYPTAQGTRYAVVMVKNSGVAKKSWGWHHNVPLSTITSYAKNHGMRVIDVDRNPGGTRFSAVYVKNAGVDAKGWWHYYNVSFTKVKQLAKQHGARPLNLERRGNGKYDVVLQKKGGEYWWWYVGITGERVSELANQHGARVFQVKSYVKNGKRRYDALYIGNVSAETRRVYKAAGKMQGKWGFYLKQVGGSVKHGIGHDNVFEPASMMKIVHAVTAMREIQNTGTTSTTPVTWYARPSDPARYQGDFDYADDKNKCAYDGSGNLLTGNTYSDALGPIIIQQMMVSSDNRTTDALTMRYGFGGLNATIDLAGMTKSSVNHRIGCPVASSPQPRENNDLTLRDSGRIYEGVANLSLLDLAHRNELYGYMNGGPIGNGALRNMVIAEAEAAGLSDLEVAEFVSRVATRSKGGSYDSCPNFAGGGACNPDIRVARTVGGTIWLPFKVDAGTAQRVVDRPYVYGRYYNTTLNCTFDDVDDGDCAGLNSNAAGMNKVAVEMFRAEVKKALATW